MRPAFGPSCNEFVYPGCWHFDSGAKSKIDDVHIEHGGLPHDLPLAVYLGFFFGGQVEGTIPRCSLLFEICFGTPTSCLKGRGWWVFKWVGALQHFSVSPKPLGFGFLSFGARA